MEYLLCRNVGVGIILKLKAFIYQRNHHILIQHAGTSPRRHSDFLIALWKTHHNTCHLKYSALIFYVKFFRAAWMLVRYTWLCPIFLSVLRVPVCTARWFLGKKWQVLRIWDMFATLTLYSKVYQTVRKYTNIVPNITTCIPYQVICCLFASTFIVDFKMPVFQSRSRSLNFLDCAILNNHTL